MAKGSHAEKDKGHPPYETRDATLRPLLVFAGILVAGTFLVLAAMALLLRFFESQHAQADPPAPPLVVTQELPPGPLLETIQGETLTDIRQREEQILKSYDWVDRDQGIVRVPIDRALELTAERGLPFRGDEEDPQDEKPESTD